MATQIGETIQTQCPECQRIVPVKAQDPRDLRPELQCAACPACTRVYRVQANLAPTTPAAREAAPCADDVCCLVCSSYVSAEEAAIYRRADGLICRLCRAEARIRAQDAAAQLAARGLPPIAGGALDWTRCRTPNLDGQPCVREDDHEGWHRSTDRSRWPYGCLTHHGTTNGHDRPAYCPQCDGPTPADDAARWLANHPT